MKIVAIKELEHETRVAITPKAAKSYIKLGLEVLCEHHAGVNAGYHDHDYEEVGASIIQDRAQLIQQANVMLCVNEPTHKTLKGLPEKALLICPIDNEPPSELLQWCQHHQISVFSMNHVPRITRAQNIDSLSSQANLAGYRAVIEAVSHFNRAIPMMMTAAGMIQPAKVLILGAGVAGLQAIATAKRLGAVVYAFDVRQAAKEQVQSLGAEFIEVKEGQDNALSSGYAKEVSEEYRQLQSALIDQYARLADIIICTALIPGKKAPTLISKETVENMKPGSIIVDLATSRGGNCELSVRDKIVKHQQVTLIGHSNIAGLIPATASDLYANNLVHLISFLKDSSPTFTFNEEDEMIRQALICHDGQLYPFQSIKEAQHD